MSVHKYSITPDSNTSVGDGSDAVGLQEGMPRQNVNNAMRAIASDIAKNYKDHGSLVTAGTGTDYTVFAQSDFTAYFVGLSLVVKLHADCGANATINVNGRGAKQLRMRGPNGVTNVEANALRANEVVHIVYNGTQFHVVGAFDNATIEARLDTAETDIDALEAKYTTTGTVVFNGPIETNGGSFYSDALPGQNAHYWLRDENNTPQGLLYWDNANDYVKLRRYNAAGTNADGELELRSTEALFNGWKVWTQGNDGAGSALDADLLDGQQGSFYQNASNLDAGTVPSARLSGTYSISISGNANTATDSAKLNNRNPSEYLSKRTSLTSGWDGQNLPLIHSTGTNEDSYHHDDSTNEHVFRSDAVTGDLTDLGQSAVRAKYGDFDHLKGDVNIIELYGAKGIKIPSDGNSTTNSGRLFMESDYGNVVLWNYGGNLAFATGGSYGTSSGTIRAYMRQDGSFYAPNANTATATDLANVGTLDGRYAAPAIRKTAHYTRDLTNGNTYYPGGSGEVLHGVYTRNYSYEIDAIRFARLQIQRADGVWVNATG